MKHKIPTHDPQTGELNPYYEELTRENNPLTGEIKTKYPPLRFDKEFHFPPSYKDIDKMPNQKKHQIVSFIKSAIRIVGYIVIPFDLPMAALILVFSEVIGIYEELV